LATLSDFEGKECEAGKRQGKKDKKEGKVAKREGKKDKGEVKNDFEGDISTLISGELLHPEIHVLCETLNINTKNPIAFLVKEFLQDEPDEKTLKLRAQIQRHVARQYLLETRGRIIECLLPKADESYVFKNSRFGWKYPWEK
jgi:hypothetical protein